MRCLIACLALLCCAPALAQTAPTVIDDGLAAIAALMSFA